LTCTPGTKVEYLLQTVQWLFGAKTAAHRTEGPRASQIHIVFVDGLIDARPETFQQFRNDGGLVLGVAARPGARFHFEEVTVRGGMEQSVDVYVKLGSPVADQPAAAVLFDFALAPGLEVLAVEARGMRRRSEEARTEQQHRAEGCFAGG